jgi:hypothetical protein
MTVWDHEHSIFTTDAWVGRAQGTSRTKSSGSPLGFLAFWFAFFGLVALVNYAASLVF